MNGAYNDFSTGYKTEIHNGETINTVYPIGSWNRWQQSEKNLKNVPLHAKITNILN